MKHERIQGHAEWERGFCESLVNIAKDVILLSGVLIDLLCSQVFNNIFNKTSVAT